MVCEFYEVDSTFFYFSLGNKTQTVFSIQTNSFSSSNVCFDSFLNDNIFCLRLCSRAPKSTRKIIDELYLWVDYLVQRLVIRSVNFRSVWAWRLSVRLHRLYNFHWTSDFLLLVECHVHRHLVNIQVWNLSNFESFKNHFQFRSQLKSRGSEQKRFIFFCIYAFGCPLVLVGITFFIENSNWFPEDIRPMIGFEKCWLRSDKLVEWIFAFGPISIIIAVNIVLYSITAIKIVSIHKETKLIRSGESRKHSSDKANRRRQV